MFSHTNHSFRRLATFALLLVMAVGTAWSQARRIDNEGMGGTFGPGGMNGMNNGMNNGIGAGREGRDSTVQDRKTPQEVKAWTVNTTLGNITLCQPDTLIPQFQNLHFTEGVNGEYNALGNLGSPRQSRIFFHRPFGGDYIFAEPLDYFLYSPSQFRFLDTKSPFTNITYYRAGTKTNGEERIRGTFAVNAGKRVGLGFNLDYVYGRGLYSNQSTSLFDAAFYTYYRGDRYGFHLLGNLDNLKWAENGGLTDDRYITRPEEMSSGKQKYTSSDMPVRLDRAWNENHLRSVFFEQHYGLGYFKSITDSLQDTVIVHREFVPVMKAFHTARVRGDRRRFIDYRNPSNYYAENYMPYDSVDVTNYLSVKNTVGLSLIEGINRWIPFGGSAYIQHEYRSFALPDTLPGVEFVTRYPEQSVLLGGNLRRTTGDVLHFDVTAETAILGTDLGSFKLTGTGDVNVPLFDDTLSVAFDAFLKNMNPSFYYRHFHSQHYWWDKDLSFEFRTHVGGSIAYPRFGTRLSAGVETIKNYTYLAFAGYAISDGMKTTFYNGVAPQQCPSSIQVLSATLNQDFALGILHWDNEITAQYSTRDDIIPLPPLNIYSNLYLSFTYAKVLRIRMGADVRWFSPYYAPDYCPGLGMYHLQNTDPESLTVIGGYPIANVYANFHLRACRFYVMYSHFNKGLLENANAFLVPHYPINPSWLKLGLSWNFWD